MGFLKLILVLLRSMLGSRVALAAENLAWIGTRRSHEKSSRHHEARSLPSHTWVVCTIATPGRRNLRGLLSRRRPDGTVAHCTTATSSPHSRAAEV